MAPEKQNRRLGRGLDALFGAPASAPSKPESGLRDLPVSQIRSNPFQPRRTFRAEELEELKESLKESGLLQPVTVRQSKDGRDYELIAGERRLKAATSLGWETIPAVVKDLSDQDMLTLALIENLQRSDLNPIEEAEGYRKLIEDFGHSHQSVATMVGKNRSTIANTLRMLQLPGSARTLIENGDLTAGQARPLLGLSDEKLIAQFAVRALEEGWSAREVERRVREHAQAKPALPSEKKRGRPRKTDERPAEIRRIEQMLLKRFQTEAAITLKPKGRGSVTLEFYSADDLERILDLMGVSHNPQ
jgi:ParB family chromosome partitioning protein